MYINVHITLGMLNAEDKEQHILLCVLSFCSFVFSQFFIDREVSQIEMYTI
jgi:hypothetical protein